MASEVEFRRLFLPYVLLLQSDGRYVVLNRNYKPVGLTVSDYIDYGAFPVAIKFKRKLSSRQIQALSHDGSPDPSRIYLYDDGCVPTYSDANWTAYSARLKRLAGYATLIP